MEIKQGPTFVRAIEDRTVTGIFAVFGNLDDYRDVLWPGCFAKTMHEQAAKVRHLWQHDFDSPPIAAIVGLREVGRDELPPEVLALAPDALGGAEVTRRYLPTPRGDEVLAGIKEGALNEMSFGFDAIKFDFERDPAQPDAWPTRNVREVRLFDTSDVNWGANPATWGAKGKRSEAQQLEDIRAFLAELKAGARHSATDTELLNMIHAATVDLGTTACKGIVEKATDEDTTKSRAAFLDALTLRGADLALLELTL